MIAKTFTPESRGRGFVITTWPGGRGAARPIASGERCPEIYRGSSFLSEYDSSYTEAII